MNASFIPQEHTTRRRWTRAEIIAAAVLVFLFASAIPAHLIPAIYPVTRFATDPLLLLINSAILYLVYQRHRDDRLWLWVGITYLGTFLVEAAGVATGAVFGEYAYGPTMRVQFLNVPLVIALNWTVLILATNDLVSRVLRQPVLTALLASVLIALYDYFIEPVAIKLGYWTWNAGIVPVQNYVAWSLVALAFSLPLNLFRVGYRSPLLPVYLVAQLLFFIVLNWLL